MGIFNVQLLFLYLIEFISSFSFLHSDFFSKSCLTDILLRCIRTKVKMHYQETFSDDDDLFNDDDDDKWVKSTVSIFETLVTLEIKIIDSLQLNTTQQPSSEVVEFTKPDLEPEGRVTREELIKSNGIKGSLELCRRDLRLGGLDEAISSAFAEFCAKERLDCDVPMTEVESQSSTLVETLATKNSLVGRIHALLVVSNRTLTNPPLSSLNQLIVSAVRSIIKLDSGAIVTTLARMIAENIPTSDTGREINDVPGETSEDSPITVLFRIYPNLSNMPSPIADELKSGDLANEPNAMTDKPNQMTEVGTMIDATAHEKLRRTRPDFLLPHFLKILDVFHQAQFPVPPAEPKTDDEILSFPKRQKANVAGTPEIPSAIVVQLQEDNERLKTFLIDLRCLCELPKMTPASGRCLSALLGR